MLYNIYKQLCLASSRVERLPVKEKVGLAEYPRGAIVLEPMLISL